MLRDAPTQAVIKSIRAVMAGEYWIARENISDLVHVLRASQKRAPKEKKQRNRRLTARELEVVSAVVAGYTNKDIAQKFSLSEDTVKHHLTNIFDKLGVSNRLELAILAISRGDRLKLLKAAPQPSAKNTASPLSRGLSRGRLAQFAPQIVAATARTGLQQKAVFGGYDARRGLLEEQCAAVTGGRALAKASAGRRLR